MKCHISKFIGPKQITVRQWKIMYQSIWVSNIFYLDSLVSGQKSNLCIQNLDKRAKVPLNVKTKLLRLYNLLCWKTTKRPKRPGTFKYFHYTYRNIVYTRSGRSAARVLPCKTHDIFSNKFHPMIRLSVKFACYLDFIISTVEFKDSHKYIVPKIVIKCWAQSVILWKRTTPLTSRIRILMRNMRSFLAGHPSCIASIG